MNPLDAVAEVLHYDIGRSPMRPHADRPFLGTCFGFGSPRSFLTAAHCIEDVPKQELSICQTRTRGANVTRVHEVVTHRTADVAVLFTARPMQELEPFATSIGVAGLGLDFWAYGFPRDIIGPNAGVPVPRIFRGHFQRGFQYKSPLGFRYRALELSIPAPAGLSGGPIFYAHEPELPLGLVAENIESMTILDSVEEVDVDGQITRERYMKVIQYGIAVDLRPLEDWLSDAVGHVSP